jgi:hypothetical protein
VTRGTLMTLHLVTIHLLTIVALYWLLAGIAVVALLNLAKWHVAHRVTRQVALAGPQAPIADEIEARPDSGEASDISRSIARHPAGGRRVELAARTT